MLKACINGPRHPHEHPALPVTAAQLAAEVAVVAAAGADAVHLHVKDPEGSDTLDAAAVATVLAEVARAAPGVPVGVTTGAWALPDAGERVAAIRAWRAKPHFASVNWHEDGAEEVAAALLEHRVDVEAGLWHADAVDAWLASPYRDRCCRALLELHDGLDEAATEAEAQGLLARVRAGTGDRIPVLLHGEGSSAWPALRCAARRALSTRIGLEDVLVLPDGSPAPDNATLVGAARQVLGHEAREAADARAARHAGAARPTSNGPAE